MPKYYLGLDMGTNSLGWAATSPDYRLLRMKGKDLWGVRLFSEANTSAERRGYRTARRRRQREVARMGLLREFFDSAIKEVDPGFFARLDDSKYHIQDRSENNKQPFSLFADSDYTDKEYFKEYPTIFHLRKELIENSNPHDVRFVYLAIANLYKRRGHFLSDSLDNESAEGNFQEIYEELSDKLSEMDIHLNANIDFEAFESELGAKGVPRKKILEQLCNILGTSKKDKKVYQILNLMCGMSTKLVDIFGEEVVDEEHKKLTLSFRTSNYEENFLEAQNILGSEEIEIIELTKQLHDIGLLTSITKGYNYLSQARVATYEKHSADLKQLKKVLKKYDKDAYESVFRIMKEGNYSAYVGSVNSSLEKQRRITKGRSREEFYKAIKGILQKIEEPDEDVIDILRKIDAEDFLPKQLTFENGVIPNQLHCRELVAILKNAEKYLPFLREVDESGLTVSEKIVQVFTFQIPYYVGPLGQQYKDVKGYNVWAERKKSGKVYPWNFGEKIDLAASAEKFISRMVGHCSYLTGNTALPKNSLLYEKFQILNELNNLKVYGEKITVEVKQDIYKKLFGEGKKVTLKRLMFYLEQNGYIKSGEKEVISGIDNGFKASLTTVGKFWGVWGDKVNSDEYKQAIEDIVFWGTVYGNDKKLLREKIEDKYAGLFTEQQLKRVLGFKFEGWGRLSRAFLELEGACKEDGVIRSFLGALWETNDNHMELLSDRYTYAKSLQEAVCQAEKPLAEWNIEDLEGMYLSNPVKRMVWQTLSVVRELEETIGNAPERIFVEVTRNDGEKGERKASRRQKLIDLYKAIGKEGNEWRKELEQYQDSEFKNRKLYLYYQQMGRCMYTGKAIDLHELMMSNSRYDIDHIYPRHFIKDDSIENNLVLVDKKANARKSDTIPVDAEIRRQQYDLWKCLCDKELISKEKFDRLTKKEPFTAEEKASFISRQLVETSQGVRAITQIFKQAFPDSEVVFSKASVVSDFRHKFDLPKVRAINNYHHAHDAYLNIVAGNAYFVKFTKSPINFIRESEKYGNKEEYRYHMDKIFEWNIIRNNETAWIAEKNGGPGTIKQVKQTLSKNSPLVTKRCVEKHGAITQKGTIWSAKTAKEEGYIPTKMSDERLKDVKRYGGFTAVSVAGYCLVSFDEDGENIRSLEPVPVYLGKVTEISEEQLLDYFTAVLNKENSKKQISNIRICKKLIPSDSLIQYNGFMYYLGGKTQNDIWVNSAVEMNLNSAQMAYIKKIDKACTENFYLEKNASGELVITKEKNCQLYNEFVRKYQSTLYKNQLGNVGKLLSQGMQQFVELDIARQCYVLMQVITYVHIGGACDLRDIGGTQFTGKNKINKRISNATEAVLITQSVTGIHRAEVNLLKV